MLFKRIQHTAEPVTDETISIRAYELWQERGCPESDGSDDWQAAEEELAANCQPARRRGPLQRLLDRLLDRAA